MQHKGRSEFAAGVHAGDLLAGKYRVERVLGVGGMGVVVAAHHAQLETRVAIKFMLPSMLDNEEAVGRFAREARAAAKIASEHVARVLDVGVLETGAPYMVMEYLEGCNLATWLAQRGPLAIETATEFLLQACEAVAEAHRLGIVHRDLKPANLFCVERPNAIAFIKVLDFGISKLTGAATSTHELEMTRSATALGSPLYMSPEQMESARGVDRRTDIWSMGVILYELLVGRPPFHGETLPEVCMKIATSPAPRLRAARPDAPPELEAAIAKCLEKDRERRYRDVGQLAAVLLPFSPPRSRLSGERIARSLAPSGAESLPAAPVGAGGLSPRDDPGRRVPLEDPRPSTLPFGDAWPHAGGPGAERRETSGAGGSGPRARETPAIEGTLSALGRTNDRRRQQRAIGWTAGLATLLLVLGALPWAMARMRWASLPSAAAGAVATGAASAMSGIASAMAPSSASAAAGAMSGAASAMAPLSASADAGREDRRNGLAPRAAPVVRAGVARAPADREPPQEPPHPVPGANPPAARPTSSAIRVVAPPAAAKKTTDPLLRLRPM